MAREPSQKLVDYGIIAGILFGAYVLWSFVFKTETKPCPTGYHAVNPCEGQIGWVGFLCNLGRNATGAALDCKPDAMVCPDGYIEQNGQCTAIKPGGCTITDADCKTLDPRMYLNLPTCTCMTSNYTDECTRGAQRCQRVPLAEGGYGDRKQECIFVDPFGNRWQMVNPLTPCNGTTIIPPKDPCASSECTPGAVVCASGIPKICVPLGTGCEDRGIWSNGGNACKTQSKTIDCSCGKIDASAGATCETACPKPYTGACPAPRVPSKIPGVLIDDYLPWAECCKSSGNKTAPCDRGRENMAKLGYEIANRLNEGIVGLPRGSDNICCYKKADKASVAEFQAFTAKCRSAGNQLAPPLFPMPGYSLIDQITKNYSGGEFPGEQTIACFRRN